MLGERIQKTRRPNGLFRGEASVEAFKSDWPGIPSTILSGRAEWTFDKVGGWGVVLRGYRGQDYYNLGFARTLSELQFGLVFDAGRWLEFAIVVEVGVDSKRSYLRTIGGNEGDSVGLKEVRLTPAGKVRNASGLYICVIETTL